MPNCTWGPTRQLYFFPNSACVGSCTALFLLSRRPCCAVLCAGYASSKTQAASQQHVPCTPPPPPHPFSPRPSLSHFCPSHVVPIKHVPSKVAHPASCTVQACHTCIFVFVSFLSAVLLLLSLHSSMRRCQHSTACARVQLCGRSQPTHPQSIHHMNKLPHPAHARPVFHIHVTTLAPQLPDSSLPIL